MQNLLSFTKISVRFGHHELTSGLLDGLHHHPQRQTWYLHISLEVKYRCVK